MRILHRYVLRELASPALLGLALFTFVVLMNFLLKLADDFIRLGVSAADIGLILVYSVPHTIVLTVPMAVLVGGLIAFGRLSADSEIIAMRTGGVSMFQLTVPAMALAIAAWLLNSWLCLVVLPWGNNELRQLQWRIVTSRTIASEIKPRVWYQEFPNFTLRVEELSAAGDEWRDVFLAKTDVNPPTILTARRGRPLFDEANRVFWLRLEDVTVYAGGDTPQEWTTMTTEVREIVLLDESDVAAPGDIHKDERSMNVPELRAAIAERETIGLPTAAYWVEIHKKYALPVACLVLGLLALPLGISTQRHTKATGFIIASVVIAIYYVFLENGEKFAEQGVIAPWLGMWGSNIVLGTAAVALLWAKAREVDLGVLDRIDVAVRWVQQRLTEAKNERARRRQRPTRPSTPHGRGFPRLIDRYVLAQFVRIFVLVLFGLLTIWIVSEYTEIADDVYEVGDSSLFYQYFKFRMPFILHTLLPIVLLVTVVTVFSLMSKHNEVVAVLSGGTSVYRLALPILLPGVLLTTLHYLQQDYVLPSTNRRVEEIRQIMKPGPTQSYRSAQGTWIYAEGSRIIHYLDYDEGAEAGPLGDERPVFQGLYVFYKSDGEPWIERVEYADRAEWQEGSWQGQRGWTLRYLTTDGNTDAAGNIVAQRETAALPLEEFVVATLPLAERPDYFNQEQRTPDQMTALELRAFIDNLEKRGFESNRYRVDFQQKLAFPAITMVLAIVGIPFGFRMGRHGTFTGIGLALGLAMLFWVVFIAFRAVGYAEILPPVLSAWTPHMLFLAMAGYLTLGLRT